jgi:small GTP-binding protein
MASSNNEKSCSLVVIGDGSVGKSTIINLFRTDGFQPVYKQTIGCDFYEKQLLVRNNTEKISLRLWDIGGQSISSKNLAQYLQAADGILLVYDITNKDSFNNLDDWLTKVKQYKPDTPFLYLIGNKIDLISLRQVSENEQKRFIQENNLKDSCYCSAKTGENVIKMFYRFVGEIVGIQLTQYELAFYDKVLKAYVMPSNQGKEESRNEWADEIEREDAELERKKREKENNHGCNCCIS